VLYKQLKYDAQARWILVRLHKVLSHVGSSDLKRKEFYLRAIGYSTGQFVKNIPNTIFN